MLFEAANPVVREDFRRAREDFEDAVLGLASLTPAESKRLIARAVAALPQVRRALENGRVVIANGTTTAYIAEEILGTTVHKYYFASGIISEGTLAAVPAKVKVAPYLLHRGEPVNLDQREFLEQFEADDVFIKSANAVDAQGMVGILLAHPNGGMMGQALGIVYARGCHFIVPVGLEKLVLSVPEAAARKTGILRFKYALGLRVGLVPVIGATVVTEIQALRVLTGATATHIGSGGIDGSEGSVVLSLEGSDDVVSRTLALIKSIKGEAPTRPNP